MDIDEITRIAELMQRFDLSEFVAESEGRKVTLKRGVAPAPAHAVVVAQPPAGAPQPPSPAPLSSTDQLSAPDGRPEGEAMTINSPIVGTFYSSPSTDRPPYVRVGDEVNEDTVVCIVEAMKVMNEIKAEACGRIERVLVENATPVEFGQPLYQITPL